MTSPSYYIFLPKAFWLEYCYTRSNFRSKRLKGHLVLPEMTWKLPLYNVVYSFFLQLPVRFLYIKLIAQISTETNFRVFGSPFLLEEESKNSMLWILCDLTSPTNCTKLFYSPTPWPPPCPSLCGPGILPSQGFYTGCSPCLDILLSEINIDRHSCQFHIFIYVSSLRPYFPTCIGTLFQHLSSLLFIYTSPAVHTMF